MPNFFEEELTRQLQNQTAQDFVAERKRLREARMKWIDENECPSNYALVDADGNTFSTPFQIGKIRYDRDEHGKTLTYPEEGIQPKNPLDDDSSKPLLDGVEVAFANEGSIVSIQQGGIFVSDKNHQAQHPPIMEGEDYGEYVKRVGSAYERQAAGNILGGTASIDGGVRDSGGSGDSAGPGRSDGSSSSGSERSGSGLGSDTDSLRQAGTPSSTDGSGDADGPADDIRHH